MSANPGCFVVPKERKVTPRFIETRLLYYVENQKFPESDLMAFKLTLGLASVNV